MNSKILFYDRLTKALISEAKEISDRYSILPDGWFPVELISEMLIVENDTIILTTRKWGETDIPKNFSNAVKILSKMNLSGKSLALLSYEGMLLADTPPYHVADALSRTGITFVRNADNLPEQRYPGTGINIADNGTATIEEVKQYTKILNNIGAEQQ